VTAQESRARIFAELKAAGFRPAESLPLPDVNQPTRPVVEVASRLMALDALVAWVVFPEQKASTQRVRSYMERNGLRVWLTSEEIAIVDLARINAHENHLNNIGWRLENMWSLAWVLGFQSAPDFNASQITDEVIRAMIFDFLPGLDADIDALLARSSPRSAAEVVEMEYRFYCAHNAVRSAQLGSDTVPAGFDPIAHGGAVHERRHSLSWCIAPGVAWDDTDLST
jgi:hypothetical protein